MLPQILLVSILLALASAVPSGGPLTDLMEPTNPKEPENEAGYKFAYSPDAVNKGEEEGTAESVKREGAIQDLGDRNSENVEESKGGNNEKQAQKLADANKLNSEELSQIFSIGKILSQEQDGDKSSSSGGMSKDIVRPLEGPTLIQFPILPTARQPSIVKRPQPQRIYSSFSRPVVANPFLGNDPFGINYPLRVRQTQPAQQPYIFSLMYPGQTFYNSAAHQYSAPSSNNVPIVIKDTSVNTYEAIAKILQENPKADICIVNGRIQKRSHGSIEPRVEGRQMPSEEDDDRSDDGTEIVMDTGSDSKNGGPHIMRLNVRKGGVAIAGPGGVATAGSGGTAIVGPGGVAYTSPDGLAVVGPGGKVVSIPEIIKSSQQNGETSSPRFNYENAVLARGPVIFYHPPETQ